MTREKLQEAQEAVLDALIAKTKSNPVLSVDSARGVAHLAEAYAWLVAPAQAHGGIGTPSSK